MAKTLAVDLAPYNIRVNCVCPGTIDTPLVEKAIAKLAKRNNVPKTNIRQSLENAQPIKRLGKPSEVASVVYYLAGDEAGFVTGASWVIDGGYTAQ